MQEASWYNLCHTAMSSLYRFFVEPPGGETRLLLEVDNPDLSTRAVQEAILRAARKRPVSRASGRPGRPIRAWVDRGNRSVGVFPSLPAFAESLGVSTSSVWQQLRKPRVPVDEGLFQQWGGRIPLGLPVALRFDSVFLFEDEYQAFLDGNQPYPTPIGQ